jgi:hypothetical protein
LDRILFGTPRKRTATLAVVMGVPLIATLVVTKWLLSTLTKGESLTRAAIAILLACVGLLFFNAVGRLSLIFRLALASSVLDVSYFALWALGIYGIWWAFA